MATQTKLLRVLQEKEIERVGDHRPIRVDVRIITATHKNLPELIRAGRFREDLYYRINVIPIHLPPLRRRQMDIPALTEHVIREIAARSGKEINGITDNAMTVLMRYPWPGNVRELINAIEYAFVVCNRERIGTRHLPPNLRGVQTSGTVAAEPGDRRTKIRAALERTGWNRTKAAAILGVSRVTLWKWMKELALTDS